MYESSSTHYAEEIPERKLERGQGFAKMVT